MECIIVLGIIGLIAAGSRSWKVRMHRDDEWVEAQVQAAKARWELDRIEREMAVERAAREKEERIEEMAEAIRRAKGGDDE